MSQSNLKRSLEAKMDWFNNILPLDFGLKKEGLLCKYFFRLQLFCAKYKPFPHCI